MSDIDERMAAYTKHDHNVAWKALWDRCEQAEAEVATLRIQVETKRTETIEACAKLADQAQAGHDEVYAVVRRDHALTEGARELMLDRIASRSRTAQAIAISIRSLTSEQSRG